MNRKNALLILFLFLFFLHGYSQTTRLNTFDTDSYGGLSGAVTFNGKLFFSAFDTIHGRELWVSDGTVTGTHIVKDIYPGPTGSIGNYFEMSAHVHNNILCFRADDGIFGTELWRTDGTGAGTFLVRDIVPGNTSSSIGGFASAGSNFFFTANSGSQLWRSDGTFSGTVSVASFTYVGDLTGFNGNLYFSAHDNNSGQELWKCNGTTFNTFLLKDLNGVFGTSLPCNFHAANNALYFMANTNNGWELWKTDGTSAGTLEVMDINPGLANGVMSFYSEAFMSSIGDTVYFRADDGSGYQLWRSDGSLQGTVKLSNLPSGVDAYCRFPVVEGKVLFSNYSLSKFWEYDPLTNTNYEGNYPFFDFFNNYTNKYAFNGNKMFYAGKDSLYGPELWMADGTLSGIKRIQETHLVDNWTPGSLQGFNSISGITGNKMLFTQARSPYNTKIPLFEFDFQNTNTCLPPSVIVPVPVSPTAPHVVWNRTENTSDYEIRYQKVTSSVWLNATTDKSYFAFQNLDSVSEYRIQLRSFCQGSWTSWSDTILYNTGFLGNDYYTNVLAERVEDSTTVRLYWLRSVGITQVQFRYRPYGTTAWTMTTNASGFKKLTGLTPSTFYEYTYRENFNGSWGQWYFGSLYFATPGNVPTSVSEVVESIPAITIYPNPATDKIKITLDGELNFYDYNYSVFDINSRLVMKGELNTDQTISIGSLSQGWYGLQIENKLYRLSSGFIKK